MSISDLGEEFSLPVAVGVDMGDSCTQIISATGWHVGVIELSPDKEIAKLFIDSINACEGITEVRETVPALIDTLRWMVEAHDSGLLVCREGTAGDRAFHQKRLDAARSVLAKIKSVSWVA